VNKEAKDAILEQTWAKYDPRVTSGLLIRFFFLDHRGTEKTGHYS